MNYELLLRDTEEVPRFQCPVCKSMGLVTSVDDENRKTLWNICHTCGYTPGNKRLKRDEKRWRESWNEAGSLVLFDLPVQKRCELYKKIQESYYSKKYYVLSVGQIRNRTIENRCFSQHGLKKRRRNKSIVVRSSLGWYKEYPYETNKIITLADEDSYIALVEELFQEQAEPCNPMILLTSYDARLKFGGDGGYGDTSTFVTDTSSGPNELALPPYTDLSNYQTFMVTQEIPDVTVPEVADWAGSSGGGTQYELPMPISYYVENGYLIRVG